MGWGRARMETPKLSRMLLCLLAVASTPRISGAGAAQEQGLAPLDLSRGPCASLRGGIVPCAESGLGHGAALTRDHAASWKAGAELGFPDSRALRAAVLWREALRGRPTRAHAHSGAEAAEQRSGFAAVHRKPALLRRHLGAAASGEHLVGMGAAGESLVVAEEGASSGSFGAHQLDLLAVAGTLEDAVTVSRSSPPPPATPARQPSSTADLEPLAATPPSSPRAAASSSAPDLEEVHILDILGSEGSEAPAPVPALTTRAPPLDKSHILGILMSEGAAAPAPVPAHAVLAPPLEETSVLDALEFGDAELSSPVPAPSLGVAVEEVWGTWAPYSSSDGEGLETEVGMQPSAASEELEEGATAGVAIRSKVGGGSASQRARAKSAAQRRRRQRPQTKKTPPHVRPKSPAPLAPRPPSGGGSTLSSTPRRTQSDSEANGRIVMLDSIFRTSRRDYSRFMQLFRNTGLRETVQTLLPFYGITLMVPNNAAIAAAMGDPQLRALVAAPDKLLQLVAFHVWIPDEEGRELVTAPAQTNYSTADYPQRGIRAWKLSTDDWSRNPSFNGRLDNPTGAKLSDPNMYYDARWPTKLIAHGIDKVMIPMRWF